jgi:hypothetical protein
MHQDPIRNPLPSTRQFEGDQLGAVRPSVRLLLILDQSLSMAPHQELVAESLRSFVNTLKGAPDQPRYLATLVGFADQVQTIFLAQPIEKLAVSYKADGAGTALFDAMAHAFILEKSRREHVICLIVSDGEENASKEADREQVASMVRSRREWGNWTFLWLNLQGKPSKSARTLGINCVDSTLDQINKSLPEVANQICRVAARLTGGDRRLLPGGLKR